MKKPLLYALISLFIFSIAKGQPCSPQGNQTDYGTNSTWRGYVYNNSNLTGYSGYVTEGTNASPNFDQSFGGDNAQYATNGCPVETNTFSVRYKLTRSFTNAVYEFTVGGDDGYRLSLDGGSTWIIDRWVDQSYTVSTYAIQLNGSYNMVLEFYENGGGNRISFSVATSCTGTENTAAYGASNHWSGYVYDGTNFNTYRGMIQRGNGSNASFDENFGGSSTTFATSGCTSISTETFSVRFRLSKLFAGQYTFFIGGDDGYRLSLDGGNTWVINRWNDQSYNVSSYTATLAGTYNMVLEYFENGGDNRINFHTELSAVLPIKLLSFTGTAQNGKSLLNWDVTSSSNPDHFELERSADAVNFAKTATIKASAAQNSSVKLSFNYTDHSPLAGKSFYRLKMTDLTGVVTYSPTVAINMTATATATINVFPTILTGTTLSLQSTRTIQQALITVVNSNGVVIASRNAGKIPAGQVIPFALDNSSLQKGVYFIRVSDTDGPVDTKRFVVQ